VAGFCDSGIGVYGQAEPIDSRGVVGISKEGFGVAGVALEPLIGYAGFFEGDVRIKGNSIVEGWNSAAVPHPDGSRRDCMR
jgi:hypothetical protein